MKRTLFLAGVAALAVAPALAQPQPNAGQPPARAQAPAPGMTAPAGPSGQAGSATVTAMPAAQFMRMTEMSDRFEIGSSRLAQERAQNAQVKQFAEQMVRDHTKTTQELTQLMQRLQGATGTQTSGVVPQGTGGASATPGAGGSTGAAATARSGAGSPGAAGGPTTGGGGTTVAQGGVQSQGLDAEHQQMLQRLQNARGAEFDRLYMQMQVQAHQKAVDMFTGYSQQGDNAQLKQWAAQTLPDLQRHLQQAQQIQRGL